MRGRGTLLVKNCFVATTKIVLEKNGLNDVLRMWQLLMSEGEETAAYTCPVRPVNQLESFLAASQALECETTDFKSRHASVECSVHCEPPP